MASDSDSMDVDTVPNVKIKKEPMEDDTKEDESDPIVKEIPVFLSKTLAQNLLLFQVRISNFFPVKLKCIFNLFLVPRETLYVTL